MNQYELVFYILVICVLVLNRSQRGFFVNDGYLVNMWGFVGYIVFIEIIVFCVLMKVVVGDILVDDRYGCVFM